MTAKKKTLIELMLDAGVQVRHFCDIYEFAAQDSNGYVCLHEFHPEISSVKCNFHSSGRKSTILISSKMCSKWKRTIITKQQFVDAYNEKNKQVCKLDAVDLSAGFRERAMNKCVTNIAEDKQVEEIEPCRVVDNRAYDCTTTDDSGISLSLVDVAKSKSDGSTASYYELPEGAKELQDLISHRDMNSQVGEIFRACYRYGLVEHSDKLRDAKKIKFYADAEIKRLEKLQGSK